jgi:hypothetical protein
LSALQLAGKTANRKNLVRLTLIVIAISVPLGLSYASDFHVTQAGFAVKSRTGLGVEFSGVMIEVDGQYYTTPFFLTLQGNHTFSARSIPRVNTEFLRFAGWQDEAGNVLSTRITFTHDLQSTQTLFAVYSSGEPLPLSGTPSYTLVVDPAEGSTQARNDETGGIEFSGNDPAQVLQEAVNALATTGGSIFLSPGTYVWQSVPRLPKDLPAWLKIVGKGDVTVKLTSAGLRMLDFNKTADYDTFRSIWVENLQVDCNNVGGKHHVVIGTYIDGSFQTRINIENIVVRNVHAYHIPVDPTMTDNRIGIDLTVFHFRPDEKQTYIKNILLENLNFEGGNGGMTVAGVSHPVNVWIDNVEFRNCTHSLLSPQISSFASSNFHIGQGGFGGYAHIVDCYGEYSGDVGVEINAMQEALIERTTILDAFLVPFYYAHYNSPVDPESQRVTFRDCRSERLHVTPGRTQSGTSAITAYQGAGQILGNLIVENFTSFRQTAEWYSAADAISVSGMIRSVKLNGVTCVIDGINYASSSNITAYGILIATNSSMMTPVTIGGVYVQVTGSRSPSAGKCDFTAVQISGWVPLDLHDTKLQFAIQNMKGRLAGIQVGARTGSVIDGTISGLKILGVTDGSNARGIIICGTTTLTITNQIRIAQCDFGGLPAGGTTVSFESPSNASKVLLEI